MVLKIILLSFLSMVMLFIIAKLIGNKQISQLNVFDYIIGITIGNITAEMATSIDDKWHEPMISLAFYGVMAFLISIISVKSTKVRMFLWGKALVLCEHGKLYEKNLFKAKLDVTIFQMMCRNAGYFNLADIETAILEPNGQLSVIPVAARRPATPEDLSLYPSQEKVTVNIILGGKVIETNLKYIKKNKIWLQEQLNAQGFADTEKIQLATYDGSGEVSIYKKIPKPETKDLFE
jgi:uncharacterized membrane protein YcaP (DUF421 family)